VDGAGLCKLTSIAEDYEGMATPTWFPNGNKIAFYDQRAIYLINTDGTGRKELIGNIMEPIEPPQHAWSPDGERIAFVDISLDGSSELDVINTDGSGLRRLAYKIETAENGAARISYRGFSEATAAQLLRTPEDEEEKSALTEAKEFLTSELARTPVSAKAIKKSAREADISERTLRRAKQVLGIRSEKESDGSWTWSLPDKEAEGGQGTSDGNVGPLGKDANREPDNSAYLREEGQGAKMAKGATSGGAYTVCETAWDATCATQSTRTGSGRAARREAVWLAGDRGHAIHDLAATRNANGKDRVDADPVGKK
jgi:hypothetical protein